MKRILIVGCGDIARRLAALLVDRYLVYGLIRNPERGHELAHWGVCPIVGDLDHRASLRRLAGLAHWVIHLAPPHPSGTRDARTRHLIAALSGLRNKGRMLPHSLIYISTTGVYGDCAGAQVSETCPVHPETERAKRRVDAENILIEWGVRSGIAVSILRVPGIYAHDRLPIDRLRKATPALRNDDDVYSNHIHADDLAHIIAAGINRMRPGRAYNCVDDSELKMGQYFDLVADHFGLPQPPRISRREAELRLPEAQLSFLRESRRISNFRLKRELKVELRYPTVAAALAKLERD
jgi:nucleoside-diphosphate-sugar epimerase